jgi:hypothetical protein
MSNHIVKAFDRELGDPAQADAQMGGLVEEDQFGKSIEALETRDKRLADLVIAADDKIDKLESRSSRTRHHHDRARQPMAHDLRAILSPSASRPTSNASAISPRTSPSAHSPLMAAAARSARAAWRMAGGGLMQLTCA